jgi:hypothetical protein
VKRLLMIVALASALSGTALAGDMAGVDAPAPAPAPGETQSPPSASSPGQTQGGEEPGDMGNGAPSALLMILDLLF